MRGPVGAAYLSPLSTYRFPARSISASKPPTRAATLRSSPGDIPFCPRSMTCACTPRSLKKRSAARDSLHFFVPKSWIVNVMWVLVRIYGDFSRRKHRRNNKCVTWASVTHRTQRIRHDENHPTHRSFPRHLGGDFGDHDAALFR